MIECFRVTIVDEQGKDINLPVDMIGRIEMWSTSGAIVYMRDGVVIKSRTSVASIHPALDALRTALMTAITG